MQSTARLGSLQSLNLTFNKHACKMSVSTSKLHISDAFKKLSSRFPASDVFRYFKAIYKKQNYWDAILYLALLCTRDIFGF